MLHLLRCNIGNPKTVGNYLQALEENGFLKSEKVGKEKLYLNEQLLKILEEVTERVRKDSTIKYT